MKNSQYIRQAQYKKGFIVPLLIAVIALLVIGGGAYIYQNKKTEAPVDTGTQQTNTQISPVNTQTNNSNWKTYTNSQYGFEFKYPATWTITDNAKILKSDSAITNSKDNQIILTSPNNETNSISFGVHLVPSGKILNINCQLSESEDINSIVNGFHSIECKNLVNVNGVKYARGINAGMSVAQDYKASYLNGYFVNSQVSIIISTVLTDGTGKTALLTASIFDQIISTFKFTK